MLGWRSVKSEFVSTNIKLCFHEIWHGNQTGGYNERRKEVPGSWKCWWGAFTRKLAHPFSFLFSVSQPVSNLIGSLVGSLQPFIKSENCLAHFPNLKLEAPSVSLFPLCCQVKLETGAASRPLETAKNMRKQTWLASTAIDSTITKPRRGGLLMRRRRKKVAQKPFHRGKGVTCVCCR